MNRSRNIWSPPSARRPGAWPHGANHDQEHADQEHADQEHADQEHADQDVNQFSLPLACEPIIPTQTEEPAGTILDEVAISTEGVSNVHEPDVGDAGKSEIQDNDRSLGARLRAARECKGLTLEEAAALLKLPIRLLARLEDDDYSKVDHGVYLRGYLTSYARLVDVPAELAEDQAECEIEPTPLVATGTISRSRFLFDRYSVSATYLILTALIVAPAVWLATHGGLEQNLARTAPLDSQASGGAAFDTAHDHTTETTSATDVLPAVVQPTDPAAARDQEPVVASMAPFPAPQNMLQVAPPTAAAASGSHVLSVKLNQPSWVEVVAADGDKLEYALLPAGSERSYRSDQALSIRIGNTAGAEVSADGKALDLDPFSHANVAQHVLFGSNKAASDPADN
ncbi:MAG: RodZ domain-containing protein [Rhodanobacteraceae bacterium]